MLPQLVLAMALTALAEARGGQPLAASVASRAAPPLNESAATEHLAIFEFWTDALDQEVLSLDNTLQPSFLDDLSLLLFTIILPGGTFCVFYLLVIFGTGSPIKVPYSNIGKPGIITPWTPYPQKNTNYSKEHKCYPTYGQV